MAIDFFSTCRKFIRKINPPLLQHCLTDILDCFIIPGPADSLQILLWSVCHSQPASLWQTVGNSQIISALPSGQSRSCLLGRSTPCFLGLAKAKAPFLYPPGIPDVLPFLLFGQVGRPLLCIHKYRQTLSWSLIFQVTPNLCNEPLLGSAGIRLSPCGLTTM